MIVRAATTVDFGEMFTLQRAAFVDEAQLFGTPDVPALSESFKEFKQRLSNSDTWVATDDTRIIGAVSLREYRGVPDVERLMVAPDRRGEGVSSALLTALENAASKANHTSLQLVVAELAVKNQSIYEHLGWQKTRTYHLADYEDVVLHDMVKVLKAQ